MLIIQKLAINQLKQAIATGATLESRNAASLAACRAVKYPDQATRLWREWKAKFK